MDCGVRLKLRLLNDRLTAKKATAGALFLVVRASIRGMTLSMIRTMTLPVLIVAATELAMSVVATAVFPILAGGRRVITKKITQ